MHGLLCSRSVNNVYNICIYEDIHSSCSQIIIYLKPIIILSRDNHGLGKNINFVVLKSVIFHLSRVFRYSS